MENSKPNEITLIPKSERYIQYMIEVIIKIPRTEKYSIGTEYKTSMYKMLSSIMYLGKLDDEKKLEYINRIDAELNLQRLFLRIMTKNHWIDEKKFNVSMDLISEIGKIVGGLTKFYAKKVKK